MCMYMDHDPSSSGIESQDQRLEFLTTTAVHIVRICCDVISCALARRGLRRGAVTRSVCAGEFS